MTGGAAAGRWRLRAAAALVALACVGLLLASVVAGPAAAGDRDTAAGATPLAEPTAGDSVRSAPTDASARGLTVVTTQGFYTRVHPGDRDVADLLAFDADGEVVYHDTAYDVYFDVDPVPGTRTTVEYVAAERLGGDACAVDPCSRNLVERVNLTTGDVTRVYDAVTPQYDTGRWHDVDRLNATHLVVADIVFDRVFVVDVRSGAITWQWNASERYPLTAGGGRGDWTHLNDVEVLEDGRFMVSLRNLDSVVFLDPSSGVVDAWTLGADDDHDVLYEQHNPDYLPPERGGPAVVLADSEHNRVAEYRREDGRWSLAWTWRDPRLQWPRDADRLPNGHTLVADAHGDRVLEVGADGEVVWQVAVGRPYDVERLGTGDESAGGYAAGSDPAARGNASLGAPPAEHQGSTGTSPLVVLRDALPAKVVNGLLFVAPPWAGFADLLVAGALVLDGLVWGALEWRWSGRSVRGWLRRRRAGGR